MRCLIFNVNNSAQLTEFILYLVVIYVASFLLAIAPFNDTDICFVSLGH